MSEPYDGRYVRKERRFALIFNVVFIVICAFIVVCAFGGFFSEQQTSPTYLKVILVIVSLFGIYSSHTNYLHVSRRSREQEVR